jgi:hypothetical protein
VRVRDADTYLIRGAAVASDSPAQKYFTGNDGTVLMKLGAGKQKIRISVDYNVKAVMLDVKPAINSFNVDM